MSPFVSKAQRKYLYKFHPDIAERWAKETLDEKFLPEYLPLKRTKARVRARKKINKK